MAASLRPAPAEDGEDSPSDVLVRVMEFFVLTDTLSAPVTATLSLALAFKVWPTMSTTPLDWPAAR